MAYCENCGAPLPENIRFCGRCGAPVNVGAEVKRYCKNCHAELEPGAVFCSECGYRAEPEPEPNPGPTPNPGPEPEPVPDLEHQPSGEPRLIGEASGPLLYLKTIHGSGFYNRYLLIYGDRLELRDCRKKQRLEPVILYMRDIGLVQDEEKSFRRNGYIMLVMENGERRFLYIADRTKKASQQIRETASLIRSLLS